MLEPFLAAVFITDGKAVGANNIFTELARNPGRPGSIILIAASVIVAASLFGVLVGLMLCCIGIRGKKLVDGSKLASGLNGDFGSSRSTEKSRLINKQKEKRDNLFSLEWPDLRYTLRIMIGDLTSMQNSLEDLDPIIQADANNKGVQIYLGKLYKMLNMITESVGKIKSTFDEIHTTETPVICPVNLQAHAATVKESLVGIRGGVAELEREIDGFIAECKSSRDGKVSSVYECLSKHVDPINTICKKTYGYILAFKLSSVVITPVYKPCFSPKQYNMVALELQNAKEGLRNKSVVQRVPDDAKKSLEKLFVPGGALSIYIKKLNKASHVMNDVRKLRFITENTIFSNLRVCLQYLADQSSQTMNALQRLKKEPLVRAFPLKWEESMECIRNNAVNLESKTNSLEATCALLDECIRDGKKYDNLYQILEDLHGIAWTVKDFSENICKVVGKGNVLSLNLDDDPEKMDLLITNLFDEVKGWRGFLDRRVPNGSISDSSAEVHKFGVSCCKIM